MKSTNAKKKISICLADDHTILREGLEAILNKEPDIEVIGQASNGHEAIELVNDKRPDVLILDIAMPKLNGIEVSKRIKKLLPETKIIILSMHDNQEYIYELFSCGASAYILKEAVATDLISAIRAVYSDGYYLSPSISKKVINGYLLMKKKEEKSNQPSYAKLTSREKEILQLIAEGYSSREIAGLLKTSSKTVDTHRNNLMKKLKIHRKSELIKYAIEKGIIQLSICSDKE